MTIPDLGCDRTSRNLVVRSRSSSSRFCVRSIRFSTATASTVSRDNDLNHCVTLHLYSRKGRIIWVHVDLPGQENNASVLPIEYGSFLNGWLVTLWLSVSPLQKISIVGRSGERIDRHSRSTRHRPSSSLWRRCRCQHRMPVRSQVPNTCTRSRSRTSNGNNDRLRRHDQKQDQSTQIDQQRHECGRCSVPDRTSIRTGLLFMTRSFTQKPSLFHIRSRAMHMCWTTTFVNSPIRCTTSERRRIWRYSWMHFTSKDQVADRDQRASSILVELVSSIDWIN